MPSPAYRWEQTPQKTAMTTLLLILGTLAAFGVFFKTIDWFDKI